MNYDKYLNFDREKLPHICYRSTSQQKPIKSFNIKGHFDELLKTSWIYDKVQLKWI